MKIRKSITKAVLAANKQNAAQSTGPRTEAGKKAVSGNAEKLGIFGNHLRFRSEQEKKRYRALLKGLRKRIDEADKSEDMMAQILAAAFLRCGRSAELDARIYSSRSAGNAAVEAVLQDHDFLDLPHFPPGEGCNWPCEELTIRTGKARQIERKEGAAAVCSGDDNDVQLRAKFVNPAATALRAQAAAERRFYRALREFQKLRRAKMGEIEEE